MPGTPFSKSQWPHVHKFILLIYFSGVLIASIYVPWHATSGYISEGTGSILQRDYLGYDFLWSRPKHGRWLVEIDLATVILEIMTLTAVASIVSLAPAAWDSWQPRSNSE